MPTQSAVLWLAVNVAIFLSTSTVQSADCPQNVKAQRYYEARIHENAPSNTVLTLEKELEEFLLERSSCYPRVDSGSDGTFKWDYIKQVVVTGRTVYTPLGQCEGFMLNLFCVKGDVDKLSGEQIHVIVRISERNRDQPKFSDDNYDFTVSKYDIISRSKQTPLRIGTLKAYDMDREPLNGHVTYTITNVTVPEFVTIDASTGDLFVTTCGEATGGESIMNTVQFCHQKIPDSVFLDVFAEDYGSPKGSDSATVVIHVDESLSPQNISILAFAMRYQVICWNQSPSSVDSYEIHLMRNEDLLKRQTLVPSSPPSLAIPGRDCRLLNILDTIPFNKLKELQIKISARVDGVVAESTTIPVLLDTATGCEGDCFGNGEPICVRDAASPVGRQFEKNGQLQCLCAPGFYGSNCAVSKKCQGETTVSNFGTYHWPPSDINMEVSLPCQYGPNGHTFSRRKCAYIIPNDTAEWNELVKHDHCRSESYGNVENIQKTLKSKLRNISTLDLQYISTAVDANLESAYTDTEVAHGLIEIIGQTLFKSESMKPSASRKESTTRLRNALHNYTKFVSIPKGGSVSVNSTMIDLRVLSLTLTEFPDKDKYQNDTVEAGVGDIYAAVQLPKAVIQQAKFTNSIDHTEPDLRFTAILFKETAVFDSSEQLANHVQPIMEMSFDGHFVPAPFLSPVLFRIKPDFEVEDHKFTCAYWSRKDLSWKTDGVDTLARNRPGEVVQCQTNHFSGFSILLDFGVGEEINGRHEWILNSLSWIGCGLSAVGLVLTILTYSLFRCLNRDREGKILLNLCCAMLLMNLAFIASSLKPFLDYRSAVCGGIGILLHFSTLAALLWMGVEAVNMYRMVVRVFASTENCFLLKRMIIAWGIPAVIVAITGSINFQYYNPDSPSNDQYNYCHLSKVYFTAYVVAYLAPACATLFINSVAFGFVIQALFKLGGSGHMKSGLESARHQKRSTTMFQVRGALTVMILLGVTWIFGAFAVGPMRLPFSYIFCVLNSLQGFLVFVVRCLCYDEARQAWVILLKSGKIKQYRGKRTSGGTDSYATGSSNGGAGGKVGSGSIISRGCTMPRGGTLPRGAKGFPKHSQAVAVRSVPPTVCERTVTTLRIKPVGMTNRQGGAGNVLKQDESAIEKPLLIENHVGEDEPITADTLFTLLVDDQRRERGNEV